MHCPTQHAMKAVAQRSFHFVSSFDYPNQLYFSAKKNSHDNGWNFNVLTTLGQPVVEAGR